MDQGAVWLKQYVPLEEQRVLVARCRDLIDGPAGGYVPTVRGGGKMHVRMLCLGRHWNPLTYTYETSRSDHDGAPVAPVPEEFMALAVAQQDPLKAVALGWRPLPQANMFLSEYELAAPLTVLVALRVFWQGHDLPGGGFIGGVLLAPAGGMALLAYGIGWAAPRPWWTSGASRCPAHPANS